MNSRLERLQVHPTLRLEERKAEILARGQRVFDFGTGDPPEPAPEFVRQALIDAVPEISAYPTVDGTPALREAAAHYVRRRFGVELDPARQVLATCGSKEAIFHIPMVLVDSDSKRNLVVWGEPGYAAFEIGACFARAEIHPIPLSAESRYLFTPDDLGDELLARTAIVFLNYPHNPTGQDMPADVFRRWIEARNEHGFVIVSDECYCDLYFGSPPHSLLEFGTEGCIVVHSLSKRSGMTGYQSGFLAGDADLLATLRRHRAGMGVASAVWNQAAATAAWLDEAHVAERRAVFGEKRRVLGELIESRGLRIYPGNASLFLWVEVPSGETDLSFTDRLADAGILVAPGSYFGAGQAGFVRFALVPSAEECRALGEVWPDS
jgi:acetylornithine aminotransferase